MCRNPEKLELHTVKLGCREELKSVACFVDSCHGWRPESILRSFQYASVSFTPRCVFWIN